MGIKVNGERIYPIMLADDQAIIKRSVKYLQTLLSKIRETSRTNLMVIARNTKHAKLELKEDILNSYRNSPIWFK